MYILGEEVDEYFGAGEYDPYDPFESGDDDYTVEQAACGIIGNSDPWDDFERDYYLGI